MRSHYIVAIAVILVVSVGAILETPTSARMTVLQMQNDINLLR
jgi:hypothetical protein